MISFDSKITHFLHKSSRIFTWSWELGKSWEVVGGVENRLGVESCYQLIVSSPLFKGGWEILKCTERRGWRVSSRKGKDFCKGEEQLEMGDEHQVTSSAFQDIYSYQISKFSPTMVGVKDIQLFLGSLLVNECPCINMASLMFERNIPLCLQNVVK